MSERCGFVGSHGYNCTSDKGHDGAHTWGVGIEPKRVASEAMSSRMTEDEAREGIIHAARFAAWWWATQVGDEKSVEGRISGAIFTFLAELDGCGDHPACDIVVLESDDETGDTVGETRVSTMLHEFLYQNGWDATRYPAGTAASPGTKEDAN